MEPTDSIRRNFRRARPRPRDGTSAERRHRTREAGNQLGRAARRADSTARRVHQPEGVPGHLRRHTRKYAKLQTTAKRAALDGTGHNNQTRRRGHSAAGVLGENTQRRRRFVQSATAYQRDERERAQTKLGQQIQLRQKDAAEFNTQRRCK